MAECKVDFIFVVSPDDQSGKSTFAWALGWALGLPVAETGDCIDEPLARVVSPGKNVSYEAALAYVKEKTSITRATKLAFATEMCAINPAWMVNKCIAAGARVIVGCRRVSEIQTWISTLATNDQRAKLIIVYRPKDDGSIVPATEWLSLPIDRLEIKNDGSVEYLEKTASVVAADLSA